MPELISCCASCPGFAIFNVPDTSPDGILGGDVQRCDECRIFESDDEPIKVLKALGCGVDSRGYIYRVPNKALPALRLLNLWRP